MEDTRKTSDYILLLPRYGGNPTLPSAVARIWRKSNITFCCCQDMEDTRKPSDYLLLLPGYGGYKENLRLSSAVARIWRIQGNPQIMFCC
jgi:hypothetical protein